MNRLFQVKIGFTRIVVLVPMLGWAIKFPVIRVRMIIAALYNHVRSSDGRKFFWRYMIAPSVTSLHGLRPYMFAGMWANWNEYRFYAATRNPFVWPTIFSFFGLFNIQRIGNACGYTSHEVWNALFEQAGNDLFADNHCFDNASNFCVSKEGKLRLLDYASEGSQKVVTKYGKQLAEISGSP